MSQMRVCKDEACVERLCCLQPIEQQRRGIPCSGNVRSLRRTGAVRKRVLMSDGAPRGEEPVSYSLSRYCSENGTSTLNNGVKKTDERARLIFMLRDAPHAHGDSGRELG
jgi:hypothetical protein